MKKHKVIFLQLFGFTTILACTLLNIPEWKVVTPVAKTPTVELAMDYGTMYKLDVHPESGYGPFRATLKYLKGHKLSFVTCTYVNENRTDLPPVLMGVVTIDPESDAESETIFFEETRAGAYRLTCKSDYDQITQGFKVESPFIGEYACENCFSETWATEVFAGTEAPRKMGRNQVRLTIDEFGNVASGFI
ncbi:MAG: hypothetical protein ABIJ65_06040, partial [Chloroflexota bacterium]